MNMFEARCGSQLLYSDLPVNGRARRDDENAGEKRVDIHDRQQESSQNLEHALQSSPQARLAE